MWQKRRKDKFGCLYQGVCWALSWRNLTKTTRNQGRPTTQYCCCCRCSHLLCTSNLFVPDPPRMYCLTHLSTEIPKDVSLASLRSQVFNFASVQFCVHSVLLQTGAPSSYEISREVITFLLPKTFLLISLSLISQGACLPRCKAEVSRSGWVFNLV